MLEHSPVRLAELARAAGLSIAAVSMALRGTGTVSAATRQRVQELAKAMGYRPHLIAASLRSGSHAPRSEAVSVCVLEESTVNGTYPVARVVDGLRTEAEQLGLQIEVRRISANVRASRLLQELHHRGVRGIIGGRWLEHNCDPRLPWDDFSILHTGLVGHRTAFNSASVDVFDSNFALLQRLWDRGFRHIGFASCRHAEPNHDDTMREAAFSLFQGRLPRGTYLPEPFLGRHDARDEFLDWVRRNRPDVVVGFHVGMAYMLEDAGWRIPKDLAFVSLFNGDDAGSRRIASLTLDESLLGRTLARSIDSMIRYHILGIPTVPQHLEIRRVFHEGQTLGYPRN